MATGKSSPAGIPSPASDPGAGKWFPTAYTILFTLIALMAALTWVIPAGQYDMVRSEALGKDVAVAGTYETVESNPQGVQVVILAPINGFCSISEYTANAIDVPRFVLVIGVHWIEVAKSFLVPSTSGLAVLSMPIPAPLADVAGTGRDLVVTAHQSAEGTVNLATPASAVVMGGHAIGRVPYDRWLRFIWPLLLISIVFIMAALLAGTMTPTPVTTG